jgi:hypothetical protein
MGDKSPRGREQGRTPPLICALEPVDLHRLESYSATAAVPRARREEWRELMEESTRGRVARASSYAAVVSWRYIAMPWPLHEQRGSAGLTAPTSTTFAYVAQYHCPHQVKQPSAVSGGLFNWYRILRGVKCSS